MILIPERIIKEIKNHREKVNEYEKGSIESTRFKPYRVSMGIYEQRELGTYMVRTRIPAGVITLEQLKKISELADLYAYGAIHFTTRQDIQFHKVNLKNTADIMEGLLEVGIMTRGTGGNTARNVVCSPLSGVDPQEVFDVTEYAQHVTIHLLNDPTTLNLPRKFKIGFSNTLADTANATISDLGFVAKIQNAQQGFEVYGAGSLGPNPTAAIKLEDFIPGTEVLHHVQAMKELFENEGDRTNKHKARIRYILFRLGEQEFRNRYRQQVQKVKAEKDLDIKVSTKKLSSTKDRQTDISNQLLIKQKDGERYAVYIHPENGNMNTAQLNKIIGFADQLENKDYIRISNTQGFYIRELAEDKAEELLNIASEFISSFDIDNSIACAGAATCQLGLCLSQNLLVAIKDRFKNESTIIKPVLPRIYVSGCPNSCGQHQIGKIGLSGKAKRTEDGLIPMYTIHLGGNTQPGDVRLAQPIRDIPAKKIPEFLYQLAQLKLNSNIVDFDVFISQQKKNILHLIKQFSETESKMQNVDLYYDFGSNEEFSLKGRGAGECSAGVLDVIKLDISNAQEYLEEFNENKNAAKLYHSALSACRALLILKGIDINKDREIFKQFVKNFIETGYVKSSIEGVIDNLIDYKLGDIDNLEAYYPQIAYLVTRVKAMYESLDPQLEITLQKDVPVEETTKEEQKRVAIEADIVDLRGVKCPINFVKTKLVLDNRTSGQVTAFYLDDGDPIQNVPRSLEAEGHQIMSVDTHYDGYNLLTVKKKIME
jgi:sulfite reductase (ferredoxin)